jgi:hypothetical protein
MMNVNILSVVMTNVIMLSVVMSSVITLSVIMTSVVSPPSPCPSLMLFVLLFSTEQSLEHHHGHPGRVQAPLLHRAPAATDIPRGLNIIKHFRFRH